MCAHFHWEHLFQTRNRKTVCVTNDDSFQLVERLWGKMQAQGSTLLSDWCFRSLLQLHLLTDVLGHCYDFTFCLMFQVTVTTPPSDWCFRSQLRLHLLTDVSGHGYDSTFWLMFQVTVTTPPSDWCFRSLLQLHLLTDVSGHGYNSTFWLMF